MQSLVKGDPLSKILEKECVFKNNSRIIKKFLKNYEIIYDASKNTPFFANTPFYKEKNYKNYTLIINKRNNIH